MGRQRDLYRRPGCEVRQCTAAIEPLRCCRRVGLAVALLAALPSRTSRRRRAGLVAVPRAERLWHLDCDATSRPSSGRRRICCWRLALPPGHSSPILLGDRIYLTGFRGDALVTIAIDRTTGQHPVGAAGAAGQDEGRRQAQQPGVAESGRRRQRRLRLLSRLRPDRLRRARAKSCGRCRSVRSTTSTAWARRR